MERFDQYQFAGRSREKFPVSARPTRDGWISTGVAFEDYERMGTQKHTGNQSWHAPFAFDDKKLRQVLIVRGWQYVHGAHPLPPNITYDEINKEATAKALRGHEIGSAAPARQHGMQASFRMAVRRAGGYLQLQAAVAFRAWRLGQDSVTVGESLGMTPVAARQMLWRIKMVALQLGFDAGRASRNLGRLKDGRRIDRAQVLEMYSTGMSVSEIACSLNADLGAIRCMLLSNGHAIKRPAKLPVSPKFIERSAKTVELFRGGASCKQIASELNVNLSTVYAHLRRAGIKRPKPEKISKQPELRKPKVDSQKALELRLGGMTHQQIANEFGASERVVGRALKRAGYQNPPKPERPPKPAREPRKRINVELVAELRAQGLPFKRIGEQLGFTKAAVALALRRAAKNVPSQRVIDAAKVIQHFPTHPKPPKVSGVQVAELRAKGLSYVAIGKELGCATMTAYNAFKRTGLLVAGEYKPRRSRKKPDKLESKVIELFKTGMPFRRIAVECGYAPGKGQNRVRRIVMRAGLYMRKAA